MSSVTYSVVVNDVNSGGVKLTANQSGFSSDTFRFGDSFSSGDLYVNDDSNVWKGGHPPDTGEVRYDGNAIWIEPRYPYYDDGCYPWQVKPTRTIPYPYVPSPIAPPVPHPPSSPLNTNTTISIGGPSPYEGWRTVMHSDRIEMAMDVPGVDPNEIDLTISKGYVILKGKRRDTGETLTKMHPIDMKEYDPSATDAEVKNGVITVTILKCARRRPKRIKVKDANDGS